MKRVNFARSLDERDALRSAARWAACTVACCAWLAFTDAFAPAVFACLAAIVTACNVGEAECMRFLAPFPITPHATRTEEA